VTTVFYALGGGRGHFQRAWNLAERTPGSCVVLHQAARMGQEATSDGRIRGVALGGCTLRDAREALERELVHADHLVVDTFPAGVAHELVLPSMRTTLVARHLDRASYADYDEHVQRFHEVWLPYHADASEWDDPPAGRWIGPIVRPVSIEGEVDLLVIGDGEPASWAPLLASAMRVRGPFERLPRARRTVALAAGYNLAWELHSLGVDAAFRPLPRRFDDQFSRAARLGRPLHHRVDLERYLEVACS
jgi:hypothetical protein